MQSHAHETLWLGQRPAAPAADGEEDAGAKPKKDKKKKKDMDSLFAALEADAEGERRHMVSSWGTPCRMQACMHGHGRWLGSRFASLGRLSSIEAQ